MSYDLYFLQPAEGAPVNVAALADWFSSRKGYEVSQHGAWYTDPALGFRIGFGFREASGEDAPLELIINGPRPQVFAHALEPEVRAVVEKFKLRVDDPQQDGMGRGEYSGEKLVAGWSFFNRFLHQVLFGRIGQTPPPTLPAERWEAMWRWNQGKAALEDGDRVFVPTIELGILGERAVTWVALAGAIATRLPDVDYVMTPSAAGLRLVPFSSLALQQFPRAGEPAPHFVVDEPDEAFAESLNEGESSALQRVAAETLLTDELVRAGVEQARPSEFDEIQTAIKAFHLSQYAHTIELCEKITGGYRETAEVLAAHCLAELGQYERAEELFAKILAQKPGEPMYWNSRAYFLVGAHRDEEAKQCYGRALELLGPLLEGEPSQPEDLWSRKAYALLGLARPKEARTAAEKALSIDKDHFNATQNLGRASIALGDLKTAKTAIARAHELRPTSPYPRFYEARILAAEGKKQPAREALHAAVTGSAHLRNLASRDPYLSPLL
jgi:tetratricopeptide (TPR) repeat protein